MLIIEKRVFLFPTLFFLIPIFLFKTMVAYAQPAPAVDENIPYLVTFGKDADKSWGDDDFCQIFFCKIPKDQIAPIYIRVFDPDTGGDLDEPKGDYNTKIRFSVYGGKNCWSDKDAQDVNPVGNYKSGINIASKTFGSEPQYNNKWYTFGPFNPFEGEYIEKFG